MREEENKFLNGEFEDISSVSSNSDRFEDIVSDTSLNRAYSSHSAANHQGDASQMRFSSASQDVSGAKHEYRRKKKGMAAVFAAIGRWWRELLKWQKAAIITLTCILLIIGIAFGSLAIFLKDFNHDTNFPTHDSDLGVEEKINEKIINIALFGVDSRKKNSFDGLSDSIMILSLNTETKKVKIISLMRDSLVPIVRDGKTTYTKLNQAYAKGGPELAVKTLNTIFHLDITEYATVNFYGMEDIIDAVGGIDATLTENEVKAHGEGNHGINDMIWEICDVSGRKNPEQYYLKKAGTQHLTGLQAVAYSRIRYVKNIWGTNNDFGRTDRQRYVMQQLFNKALALKKSEYPSFAKKLFPYVKTSLGINEIISIAMNILLESPVFEQCRVPMSEKGIYFLMTAPKGSFGSVVYYDLEYASKVLHGVIYDDVTVEEFVKQNPIEKNDWYGKLFPGSKTESKKPTSSSSGGTSSIDTSSGQTSTGDDTSSGDTSSGDGGGTDTPSDPQETSSEEPVSSEPQTTEE